MPIIDIMTKEVITVAAEATVKEIYSIFQNVEIHHVIVVEKRKVIGVISDRDILRAVSPYAGTPAAESRDEYTLKRKAHQVMTADPITVCETESLTHAARLVLKKRVGCLPVIDSKTGYLMGIVSWSDLLRAALE